MYVGDHIDKLSRVAAIAHDEDEAQTREDKLYGDPILDRVLDPLPRLFRRGKPRHYGQIGGGSRFVTRYGRTNVSGSAPIRSPRSRRSICSISAADEVEVEDRRCSPAIRSA